MASNCRPTASVPPDRGRTGRLAALALATLLGGCSAVLTWDRVDDSPNDAAVPPVDGTLVDAPRPADVAPVDRGAPAVDTGSTFCVVREQCASGQRCCRARCAQCCDDSDCPGRASCTGGRCQ